MQSRDLIPQRLRLRSWSWEQRARVDKLQPGKSSRVTEVTWTRCKKTGQKWFYIKLQNTDNVLIHKDVSKNKRKIHVWWPDIFVVKNYTLGVLLIEKDVFCHLVLNTGITDGLNHKQSVPLWEISHPWTEAETVEGAVADPWPQQPSVGLCTSGRMVHTSSCCGRTVCSRTCTLSSRTASCALCALEASLVSTQWRTPQTDLSDRDQVVAAAVQPQKSCLGSHYVDSLGVRRYRPQLCCQGAPHVDLSGYFPVLPLYFHFPHPQHF